jgi:hypothetical protein
LLPGALVEQRSLTRTPQKQIQEGHRCKRCEWKVIPGHASRGGL